MTVLPKPIPGSSRIFRSSIPAAVREAEALRQKRLDLQDDIPVPGILLHRPGLAEHVHQAALATRIGDHRGHLRVAPQGRDVVYETRPGRQGKVRDGCL